MVTRKAALAALGLLLLAPLTTRAQDKPTIVKDNLPQKAVCLVCSQGGEEHGEEKPAGAVAYKGKTYYFCNKREVEAFVKDPDAYLPAPLPRLAPAFSLKRVTGETATLAELSKGKVLLVDFWATWCGPCVKAMPDLQKIHEKYATGGKFSVVGISIDEEGAKKVAPFLAKSKTKYTYPILLDAGEVWKQWGVKSLPTVVLVKDGQIVGSWAGKVNLKEVEAAVMKVLEAN
jgi:thiol-disulfide isomerase/thioredoxin